MRLSPSSTSALPWNEVAERVRRVLEHLPPERIIAAPDCGMKYLPRESARAKLKALVDGVALVNAEL